MHRVKEKNIFADKASSIIRRMFKDPGRKWVLRDFTGDLSISLGMVQSVVSTMEKRGYIEWEKRGSRSHFLLVEKNDVLTDWINNYSFDKNYYELYYTPEDDITNKIRDFLGKDQYSLTLHTGANLLTSYVKTDDCYVYLNFKDWNLEINKLREKLKLMELVQGGNVYLIKPYYKTSIFNNTRSINGFTVVSNLQLYLDLFNFQPRGRDHAEYLVSILENKGKDLD